MQDIQTIAAQFAKANKVSKVKVMSFVQELQSLMPARAAGKPLSEESAKIRNALREFAQSNQGQDITAVSLAETLQAAPSAVNNNLRALAKEGLFKAVGTVQNTGKRGRNPVIWQAV